MIKSIEKYHFGISISTAVIVIIALLSMSYSFGTWKTDIEDEIDNVMTGVKHVGASQEGMDTRITMLEAQDSLARVQIATMETRLTSIEALLIEIKQDIKDLSKK